VTGGWWKRHPPFKKENKMEIANCRVRLSKVGSDTPLSNVTPAEVMLLHILHSSSNGGLTFGEEFEKITVMGKALVEVNEKLRDRTDAEELRRLTAKYGSARDQKNNPIINSIWPDKFNPKLPQTFKELNWTEIGGAGIETAAMNYATGSLATPNVAAHAAVHAAKPVAPVAKPTVSDED